MYEDFARIPKQPGAAAAATGPTSLQAGGPGSPLKAATSDKVAKLLSSLHLLQPLAVALAVFHITEAIPISCSL